jgi:hypothetical protein
MTPPKRWILSHFRHHAIVEELAQQAGAANPKALAEELCMIMEGAYVTRQVTCNPKTIVIARRLAERTIASHLGENGNGGRG